jgi:zinc transport system ATP-binding protein
VLFHLHIADPTVLAFQHQGQHYVFFGREGGCRMRCANSINLEKPGCPKLMQKKPLLRSAAYLRYPTVLAHAANAMDNIVDISNLDFSYGNTPALRQVSIQIQRGSTIGLIGPNGGGKTTLVKLLIGLLEPAAGSITIEGMSPIQAVRKANVIGYLPQNPNRPERFPLNVRQTVRLGLAGKTGICRAHAKEDLDFVEFLLERTEIKDLADRPIGQLSGGQLQRVFIARALSVKPKILLLDEPTTGVDRRNQQRFIEFLLELKKELGLTVIMVTHDLRAVSAIADRIACLNLTLHYHDVPERLPAVLVYRMFACDLQAMGISADHQGCGDPSCDHGTVHIPSPFSGSPKG